MDKAITLLVILMCVATVPAGSQPADPIALRQQSSQIIPADRNSALKVTIATVGPLLGPPTNRYRLGEQVLVVIRMTNTSSEQTYVSVSSDLYQDRPKLTKNGQVLPYTKWQTYLLSNTSKDQTCRHEGMPERILLKPNEPTVMDFLMVVDDTREPTGALPWYDPLSPGVYELSIQRRCEPCDGPMVESNKVSFEVVE